MSTNAGRLMPDQANRLLLHPVAEPPQAHAYHHWDEANRTLIYTYNNRKIIQIQVPEGAKVSFRHGADGTFQGVPFIQQIYVIVSTGDVKANVTFQMSPDVVNMRPLRARSEQAIIGQVGRPLLAGANGLYDASQDLMVSWFGREWKWTQERFEIDADGNYVAKAEVELGPKTWMINVKPLYYNKHLGYRYHYPHKWRFNDKAVAGWCTWEAYRREVTEAKVVEGAEFFAKTLRAYGLEYIQIDDGFEELPFPADPKKTIAENWLTCKAEFPSGHAGVVKKIKENGFQAGVWTTAATFNDEWAAAHRDALIEDENGELLIGDWVKYVLNCTPETLKEHVRPYFRGLREAGYSYFKIDGIRHLLYDGLQEAVLNGLLTNDEAETRFRAFMECGREEIGDAYWLSSWGVLTQGVGLVDACRISQDAMPNWAGMQMQLVESARWWHTHRVLWTNDPDHVCVRAPFEWSRSVLSLVSLTGGLYMLSDAIEKYDADRVRLCQQTLPPLTTMTAETGHLDTDYAAFAWTKLHSFAVVQDKKDLPKPFEAQPAEDREAYNMAGEWATINDAHPFSTLWAFHLDAPAGRWCVAGRFASLPLKASTMNLEALSLPAGEYVLFDFWKQEYLGQTSGAFDVPALPLGHCQILSLRKVLDRPQLLSSSRHVSQDAVSVKSQQWADGQLTLELEGVCGTAEIYWLHVPAGWAFADVAGRGLTPSAADAKAHARGGAALPIKVDFPAGGDTTTGTLTVSFARA